MNGKEPDSKSKLMRFAIAGGLLLIVAIALLLPRYGTYSPTKRGEMFVVVDNYNPAPSIASRVNPMALTKPTATAEEMVAHKVSQFARSRREIAFGLARKHQTEVPADVERFFDAVEAGNWDELS